VDVLGTLVVLMLYNHWMEKISFVDVMKLNFLPILKKIRVCRRVGVGGMES
jgi:hypothetical protein